MRNEQVTPEAAAYFKLLHEQRAAWQAERPKILAAGRLALKRLLPIAQRDTGQSGVVAAFLLSLYNGYRFKFDLTEFRRLDREVFEDCLTVLRMDFSPLQEVHRYFQNGGEVFEQLAQDWALNAAE